MEGGPVVPRETELNRLMEWPPGVYFVPTAFELVRTFLVPKWRGERAPGDFIEDLNVYDYDPDQLPLGQIRFLRQNEAYFYASDKRFSLPEDDWIVSTPNGYWQIIRKDVPLFDDHGIFGFGSHLEFYLGKAPNGTKTEWEMDEYRSSPNIVHIYRERLVVCHVQRKAKEEIEEKEEVEEEEFLEADGEMEEWEEENDNIGNNVEIG